MSAIQEFFLYLLCSLVASFVMCSPIVILIGFFMMPSKLGAVLFYAGVIALIIFLGVVLRGTLPF